MVSKSVGQRIKEIQAPIQRATTGPRTHDQRIVLGDGTEIAVRGDLSALEAFKNDYKPLQQRDADLDKLLWL